MAQKKENEEVKVEITEQIEEKDPWKKMVRMYIPRMPYGGSHREEIFRVNDIGFCIYWNGTDQELPEPIAELVKSVMDARAREEDYRENLPKEIAPGVKV